MKKITIILSLFMLTSLFCLKAQNNFELSNRHELKLNLGSSVFLAFPEVSYEYLINDDMSVGIATGFGFDTKDSDGYKFKVTPFLRWYFGDWSWFRSTGMLHPSTGFFLEANGAVGSRDIYSYDYDDYGYDRISIKEKTMTTAGMGLAAGWKYLSRNNWVGEIFSGAGRNFNYDEDNFESKIYFRMGISIGKRF